MESSRLVVDIPEKQLLDWLKSRNLISRKWNVALKQLRQTIQSALSDYLPQELQEKYTSSETIYYSEVEDILNFVRSSQQVTGKDWLGRSKDKRLRAWEEIIEKYEKNNLLLAETAQRLSQLTCVEIPHNRREKTKQEALISSLTKRQGELRKKLEEATKECQSFFERFHLDPCLDIDIQLNQLKSKLPNIFREIVSLLQSERFLDILMYHDSFLSNLMPNRREKDLSSLRICISSDTEKLYPEIKCDTLSLTEPIQILGEGQENGGVEVTEKESFVDWGQFETLQAYNQPLKEGSDKHLQGSFIKSIDMEDIEGSDSSCSLMNDEFRKSVEADLLELKSFLEQRIKDTEDAVETPQFMVMNQEVESTGMNVSNVESNTENLNEMLQLVIAALDYFRGSDVSRILLLRMSRRYEERLTHSLQEKLQRTQKLNNLLDTCETQKQESAKLLSEAEYRYRKNIELLHKLAKLVEDRLALQFPESQIHIVLDLSPV